MSDASGQPPSSRPWVGSGDPPADDARGPGAPPPQHVTRDHAGHVAAGREASERALDLERRIASGGDTGGARRPTRDRDRRSGADDSLSSFLKELPVLLLIAFGLAFLLRTFVVQVFFIPSESMVPTLQVDDRIVVEKISYLFDGPDRGDVVVFAGEEGFPTADETGLQRVVRGVGQFLGVVPVDARDLVKRVIGLPGDRVVLTDGQVSVNSQPLDEPYAQLDQDDGEYTVPEGQLFVLGDNRDNSADSRSSLGFVDLDNVVGRAVLKIWPLDRFGGIEGADHDGVPDADGAALGLLPAVGYVATRRPRSLDDVA